MKISAGDFEAALRQKRQATEKTLRLAKRIRRRGPAWATETVGAPRAPTPVEELAREAPTGERVPEPAGTEMEEGEISVTTETAVVIVDLEEETPAAADAPEAGQVTIAMDPPATVKPETDRAPSAAKERESAAKKPRAGAEAAGKQRDGPESSSRWSGRHPTRPRVEGPQEGPARPAPKLYSMTNAKQAAGLLSRLQTDEFAEETRGLSHSALLNMVMVAVIQMANGALGLREAIAHSSDVLTRAMARADRYRKGSEAQSQSLARLHQESRAREDDLGGRLREAESWIGAESGRASAAKAKLELASEKLRATEAQGEELVRQLQRTDEEARAARDDARAITEKAAALEKAVPEARLEKAGAVACADEASAHAEEAESRAWEAEVKAKEAEARAQRAEAGVQRAEAAVGQAIADYKASPEFKQEVIEASLDAYVQGFSMCKNKVSMALKIDMSELEGISPGDSDEEPAGEEDDEGKPDPSGP